MEPDLWDLYRQMALSRLFEEAVSLLWHQGLISGEMHLGTGEEAIVAGVVTQLREGDAMALDHRATAAMLMRGVDPVRLLREFLGRADGLCAGQGGHMHLFSPEHLAVSSGIVGASGPAAAGFALAAQYLRPGCLAVAFFGEGAANQGMLLESLNLASAWDLPAVFICKDDRWAITTPSAGVTGGNLAERARGFGLHAEEVDGLDVREVWQAAHAAFARARAGRGPSFLLAHCIHREAHFLGDPLLRLARSPAREMKPIAGSLVRSLLRRRGAAPGRRLASLRTILSRPWRLQRNQTRPESDPVERARRRLARGMRLQALEDEIAGEVEGWVRQALAG